MLTTIVSTCTAMLLPLQARRVTCPRVAPLDAQATASAMKTSARKEPLLHPPTVLSCVSLHNHVSISAHQKYEHAWPAAGRHFHTNKQQGTRLPTQVRKGLDRGLVQREHVPQRLQREGHVRAGAVHSWIEGVPVLKQALFERSGQCPFGSAIARAGGFGTDSDRN